MIFKGFFRSDLRVNLQLNASEVGTPAIKIVKKFLGVWLTRVNICALKVKC